MSAPSLRHALLSAFMALWASAAFAVDVVAPSLQLDGDPADTVLVMHLALPEASFVEITIASSVGSIPMVPVRRVLEAGSHEIRVNRASLPPDRYLVFLAVNHARLLVKASPYMGDLTDATDSPQERQMAQQVLAYASQDPDKALEVYRNFLATYPRSLCTAAVYNYILPVLADRGDSATVHAAVDSLVHYLPEAETYYYIAETLTRYPTTAVQYARRALSVVDSKPLPIRSDARFKYQRMLGTVLLRLGDLAGSEASLLAALQTLATLPPGNRWVQSHAQSDLLAMIGHIRQQEGDHAGALGFYEAGVRDAGSPYWDRLGEAYFQAYGSMVGYSEYAALVLNPPSTVCGVPPAGTAVSTATDESMKVPFPSFRLQSLDGNPVELEQLRGHPSVIIFWSYACPPCLQEMKEAQRLLGLYPPGAIRVLAVHTLLSAISTDDQMRYARRALQHNGISLPVVFDAEGALQKKVEVPGTPTTFILDSKGIIRQRLVGSSDADLQAAIARIVAD